MRKKFRAEALRRKGWNNHGSAGILPVFFTKGSANLELEFY